MSDISMSESYIIAVYIRAKLDATVAVFLNMDWSQFLRKRKGGVLLFRAKE